MARFWAHFLKEYDGTTPKTKFLGTVKGPAAQGYSGANATLGTDYIVPDIEDGSLTITDTNNAYPIVSYGSKGGVRLLPCVGYSVGGAFSTKLYSEQAEFLIGSALAKANATTNPTGDATSFQIDRCHIDSDPVQQRLFADSYKGVKIGQFSLTVGSTNPMVQLNMQLVGATRTEITATPAGGIVPTTGKVPACSAYPSAPYTFKNVSVYADFNGNAIFSQVANSTETVWAVPAATKKLTTVRSISLTFQNTLASTSHSAGTLDRIQRTVTAVQYSMVVDLSDPDGDVGTMDTVGGVAYGSTVWRKRYLDMRDSINGGKVSLAVIFDNPVTPGKRIYFSLGKATGFDSVQSITPIPEIFSAQISGMAMWDADICNTFDWNIESVTA
jgi:hypothetical protein